VLGPPAVARGLGLHRRGGRVAALAATALSAAACHRRLGVKRAGRKSFVSEAVPEGREKFSGGAA
jgi:hypothetical protein